MKTLHITVKDKVATYAERDGALVCGNSDYQVAFTFDSEWTGLTAKTARFIWNGQYTDVVFNGTTVTAPVVTNADLLAVGVYAGNLHTTTPALIVCKKSILCPDPAHVDPTPDVYTQLITLLNSKANANQGAANVGKFWKVGADGGLVLGEGGGGADANAVHYTAESKTAAEKEQARTNIGAGTYSKPSGGVPKSDLASAVQSSLGKADSALQQHQDVSGKQDKTDNTLTTTNKTVVGAINELKGGLDNKIDNLVDSNNTNSVKQLCPEEFLYHEGKEDERDIAVPQEHRTNSTGVSSIALGIGTLASADGAFASGLPAVDVAQEGVDTLTYTVAGARGAHAEGCGTQALGKYTHTEGFATIARGQSNHAEGDRSEVTKRAAHAEGRSTLADAESSHAEGKGTITRGEAAHAEGRSTRANGLYSHAEGMYSQSGTAGESDGESAHAEGYNTKATGKSSHSEGYETETIGRASHAEGETTRAISEGSHAEGAPIWQLIFDLYGKNNIYQLRGCGSSSYIGFVRVRELFVEGKTSFTYNNVTYIVKRIYASDTGWCIGLNKNISGVTSNRTISNIGFENLRGPQAIGIGSHVEGLGTISYLYGQHVEGIGTIAGDYEDDDTLDYSNDDDGQHVAGRYNIKTNRAARVTGGGYKNALGVVERRNIEVLDWRGNLTIPGNLRAANIPAPPASDGNYVLKCSIVSGVATYSWEAQS